MHEKSLKSLVKNDEKKLKVDGQKIFILLPKLKKIIDKIWLINNCLTIVGLVKKNWENFLDKKFLNSYGTEKRKLKDLDSHF